MLGADLKHRRLVRVEGHQVRSFPVNRPAGVIGVDHRRRGHLGPQFLVGIADHALRLLQRILREGTLRNLHPGELPQNCRRLPHRDPHAVMHHMRGCLHARADPMRGRPILIRRHIRMLPAHPLPAPLAPVHLHCIALHFRLRPLRHVRDRHRVGPLPPQFATAERALGDGHRHFHWRRVGRCTRWRFPEGKLALSGPAARPFSPFLALSGIGRGVGAPTGRLQLLAQLLVFALQPIILCLRMLQLPPQVADLCFPLPQSPSQILLRSAFHCSLAWHEIIKKSSIFANQLPSTNKPALILPVPLLFWKSADGDATWNSYPFPGGSFAGPLAVDPNDPLIMLAGAFRSADGGQTWQPTNASRAIQPVFASSSSGIVYAAAPITSDAFLAKFLPDGQTLVFSTYFGGMGNDTGQGIALDASGNIWITGSMLSYDLPVTRGAFQGALKGGTNAFLAKFSLDGPLLAASYLGGFNTDNGLGIAISPQSNPWLIVNSNSTDFPVSAPGILTSASPIGYVTEIDASASQLLYSAGAGGEFDANGKGIAIDSSGNITLTGSTYTAFPITAGAFHSGNLGMYTPKAFVLKLSSSGQVIYSTYFGGSQAAPTTDGFGGGVEDEHDYGIAVAVDAAGNAYVAGYTSASDFPTTPGAYQTSLAGGCPYPALTIGTGLIGVFSYYYVDDAFVVKLSPDGILHCSERLATTA
jgi:hypothetical protein